MAAALQSFDKIESSNKILILGGMKELGNNSLEEHKKLVSLVLKMKAKKLYFLGEEFEGLNLDNGRHYQTIEGLIEKLSENPIKNALIFIKGSRANKLEDLVSYL
jgi:UDP-N-acetylmuramoyl-tripeptide--D-alanyl-D-alanine ligase